jgi:hypothetical protein
VGDVQHPLNARVATSSENDGGDAVDNDLVAGVDPAMQQPETQRSSGGGSYGGDEATGIGDGSRDGDQPIEANASEMTIDPAVPAVEASH